MPQRRRRARGHIRELPSGSFQVVVYAGTDPLTGKEQYQGETASTRQAAEVAITRLQGQVDEDRHPKSDLTVRQAIDQWLEVRWYARLQRCRSCDGRRIAGHVCRPLSSSTVRKIHFILSGALGRAVRSGC